MVLGYKKHYESIAMSSLYAAHGWSFTGDAGRPGPGAEKTVGGVVLSAGTTAAGAAISAIAQTPAILATALTGAAATALPQHAAGTAGTASMPPSASAAVPTAASGGTMLAGASSAVPVPAVTTRILDVDREHRMCGLELPESPFRPPSLLLSNGLQGLVLDAGSAESLALGPKERLTWAGPPVRLLLALPYIITQLADAVEIHDVASLQSVQLVRFSAQIVGICSNVSTVALTPHAADGYGTSGSGTGGGGGGRRAAGGLAGGTGLGAYAGLGRPVSSAGAWAASGGGGGRLHEQVVFVCTTGADQLSVLKMVPLVRQVSELVEGAGGAGLSGTSAPLLSRCEEALNLCSLVPDPRQLADIDTHVLHEKYALSLYQRGYVPPRALH